MTLTAAPPSHIMAKKKGGRAKHAARPNFVRAFPPNPMGVLPLLMSGDSIMLRLDVISQNSN